MSPRSSRTTWKVIKLEGTEVEKLYSWNVAHPKRLKCHQHKTKTSKRTDIWDPNCYHLLCLQCIHLQKLYSWNSYIVIYSSKRFKRNNSIRYVKNQNDQELKVSFSRSKNVASPWNNSEHLRSKCLHLDISDHQWNHFCTRFLCSSTQLAWGSFFLGVLCL